MALKGTTEPNFNNNDFIDGDTSEIIRNAYIYDTRTDSDGGAWRHKCSHTSWYNEGSSTYRGTRKEFPVVALLTVLQSPNRIMIYDLDNIEDGKPSLWMEFRATGGRDVMYGPGVPRVIAGANGAICTGAQMTNFWPVVIDFISDEVIGLRDGEMASYYGGTIAERNQLSTDSNKWWPSLNATALNRKLSWLYGEIGSQYVQGVDMYAPKKGKGNPNRLGLPNPIIALAEQNDGSGFGGGLSIINQEGISHNVTIWDNASYNNGRQVIDVKFDEHGGLLVNNTSASNGSFAQTHYIPPGAIYEGAYASSTQYVRAEYMRLPNTFSSTWTGTAEIVSPGMNNTGNLSNATEIARFAQQNNGRRNFDIEAATNFDIIATSSSDEAFLLLEKIPNDIYTSYRGVNIIGWRKNLGYVPGINATTIAPTVRSDDPSGSGANWIEHGPRKRTLTSNGSALTSAVVFSGAETSYYNNLSSSNYISSTNTNGEYDFGTGDFYIGWWGYSHSGDTTVTYLGPSVYNAISPSNGWNIWGYDNTLKCYIGGIYLENKVPYRKWTHYILAKVGTTYSLYMDGDFVKNSNSHVANSIGNVTSDVFNFGKGYYTGEFEKYFALFKVGAGTVNADQARRWYKYERPMMQPNAKVLLSATSAADGYGCSYDPTIDRWYATTTTTLDTFQNFIRVDEQSSSGTNSKVRAKAGAVVEY